MIASTNASPVTGWGKPSQSRNHHYFDASRSLCGRWSYFGATESGVPMRKRCKDCERARPAGAS